MKPARLRQGTIWLLRAALAASFLSAVADRFGWWGPPGAAGVAWGAWQPFVDYTGTLLFYLPAPLVVASAWLATSLETALAFWLLSGWKSCLAALSSAALLGSFGISMVIALGLKAPLDYSVFSAAAAALALAVLTVPSHGSRPEKA